MSVNFTLIQATDVNITGVLYRRPCERFTDACVIENDRWVGRASWFGKCLHIIIKLNLYSSVIVEEAIVA